MCFNNTVFYFKPVTLADLKKFKIVMFWEKDLDVNSERKYSTAFFAQHTEVLMLKKQVVDVTV